jgi:hypothetical protein
MGSNQSSKGKENDIKSDPITKGYFKDLQLIFIHNYIENDNLMSNMKVCLDEKNFDQVLEDGSPSEFANEQSQTIYEPVDFINWLDFLYTYLEEEKLKNRYWAAQMLDKLDEEYFLSENKYLSQFFFEEYGIQSMPDCINKKRKRERKININTSMLNVTQNLGGSFGESFNQFDNEDDAGYKYKEFRNKVKRYIMNFKEHILNKDHPINIVAQIFESVWVDFANKKLDLMRKNYPITNEENKRDIEKDVAELTYQFQKFVIKLQICLKLFYSRTINYSFFNEEKDELINLITTLIFRTGRIYEVMFSLYEFSLRNEIEDMTRKYQRLKKITPEELGVAKQFCLNKETLDLQEQILLKNLKEINEKENNNKTKSKESNEKIDLEKGTIEIDIREKNIEKNKISTLLTVIQEKKSRIPRPGDRDMEDMKVNLDFDDDNSESQNTLAIYANKNDSVYVESNNNFLGSILPKLEGNDLLAPSANVSVDNATIHNKGLALNINDSGDDLINNNINNNKNKQNEYLFSKKVFQDNQQEEGNDNVFIVRDSNAVSKNVMPFVPEKIIGRVSFMRRNVDDFLSYPYETAIQLLKQIRRYKTPFEKMMIIASISNEITDCINDFWTEMENYIKKDFLGIEAEQIMTIFIYIIIKSGITDIFVHCKMIKYFTTCTTKSSMIGYYYSTIEASITYIKTLKNVDELFQNKGKNKIFGTDVN